MACAAPNRPDNKKPGVERRARPSAQDGPARCSTVFLSGIRNQPHLVGLETGTPLPIACAGVAADKAYTKCYSRVKPRIFASFSASCAKTGPCGYCRQAMTPPVPYGGLPATAQTAANARIPRVQELRELIQLGRELNEMYQTSAQVPAAEQPQQ